MDEFDELKIEFLNEVKDLLDKAEAAFLALESGNYTRDNIDEIFRLAHSFKGSAKAVGFDNLAAFAHKMENVLAGIKNGKISINKIIVTLLLKSLDVLKTYTIGLRKDFALSLDTSQIEAELLLVSSQKSSAVAPDPPAIGEILVEERAATTDQVSHAVKLQKRKLGQILVDEGMVTKDQVKKALTKQASQSTDKNISDDWIRVRLSRLDQIIDLIGELVTHNVILRKQTEIICEERNDIRDTIRYFSKLINDAQAVGLSLRMLPVRHLFQKMQRIVRDLSNQQNKNIEFETQGEHVELDRIVVDEIGDPMTHLIRNSVDHGIENTEDRIAAGKPPGGKISIIAEQMDDHVLIVVTDDGRGLDTEKIRQKAVEKGLIDEDASLLFPDIVNLIFLPGFSTKEEITEVSGRGFGMDVVKKTVEKLKGEIQVHTKSGEGSTFRIKLPLSMSIIEGMLIQIGKQKFVIPMPQFSEVIQLAKFQIHKSTGFHHLNLREEIVPMGSLGTRLGIIDDRVENVGMVVYKDEGKICFTIPELLGQQKVVIKKLMFRLENLRGVLGASVLESGEMGIILNLRELAEDYRGDGSWINH